MGFAVAGALSGISDKEDVKLETIRHRTSCFFVQFVALSDKTDYIRLIDVTITLLQQD